MKAYGAERLFYYPVKSCAGIETVALDVDPEIGVLLDRKFGFAIDAVPEGGDSVWRRKQNFVCGMRWPEIVRLQPIFEQGLDFEAHEVETASGPELRHVGTPPMFCGMDRRGPEGATPILFNPQSLAEAAGEIAVGQTPRLVAALGSGGKFSDRDHPYVSILNLDTLEAFAEEVGDATIAEPARWRCGVCVRAGVGAEYAWARENAALEIDGVPFQVNKLLGRCAMITAEPDLGRQDHPDLMARLRAFEAARGFEHPEERAPVMGVLATPLAAGRVHRRAA